MTAKIIRTICKFAAHPDQGDLAELDSLQAAFTAAGFAVQTRRLCSPDAAAVFNLDAGLDGSTFMSIGRRTMAETLPLLDHFLAAKNVTFNLDLTDETISSDHTNILFEIIRRSAGKTFNFAYTFNVPAGSPYFPSAAYEADGFAVGLQPTDLSAGTTSVQEWLTRLRMTWLEIHDLLLEKPGYLGIDTSIAPFSDGAGSLLHIVRKSGLDFDHAVTSDSFMRISGFIKSQGVRNTGLCGLLFPCLEDFELAEEYELGRFPVERNLFLSLHSGLGIDTYPIGIDESPARVEQILQLVQGLSIRYSKPLSVRFISDGQAAIGALTDFRNFYLKDVVVRPL